MTPAGYCTFETAIGPCAIAWRGDVVTGARLPQVGDPGARRGFAGLAAAPPPAISAVIARVQALLAKGQDDLVDVAVDLAGLETFDRQVLELTRRIPPGRTRTYGQLAADLGQPRAAQAVGAALGRNPIPIIVPCHRVLAAGGRSGGFSAPGGVSTKLKLLAIENARVGDEPTLL